MSFYHKDGNLIQEGQKALCFGISLHNSASPRKRLQSQAACFLEVVKGNTSCPRFPPISSATSRNEVPPPQLFRNFPKAVSDWPSGVT